jgi:hypothetical protein
MNLLWVLLIVVLVFAVIGAPQVGVWHHGYGYWPSGLGFILFIVLLILLLR